MSQPVQNQSSTNSNNEDSCKDRESGAQAKYEFDQGNYEEALKILDGLNDNKSVELNRIVTKFALSADVDQTINNLTSCEDLELDQQGICGYNHALLLAKYKKNYDDAIKILEERLSALPEPFGLVDEKVTISLCHLLSILYIERRKDPARALRLLNLLSDKFASSPPPRFVICVMIIVHSFQLFLFF